MKKGISFYFGFNADPAERAKLLRDVGFECVMTSADPRFSEQNGTIKKQIKLFKKYGLALSSLHMRYKTNELPEFWKVSKIGDRIESDLVKDVKLAAKFGFNCVVVHLLGNFNEIGTSRLARVLEVCRKYDTPLAIENIDDQDTFLQTMHYFENHPYVKMCYDSGHNHCFDPDFDYLTKFKDKIICLHLHDNLGIADDHTLNKYGNIDWDKLAQKLADLKHDVNLDYELLLNKRGSETIAETAQITLEQAKALAEKIGKFKMIGNKC